MTAAGGVGDIASRAGTDADGAVDVGTGVVAVVVIAVVVGGDVDDLTPSLVVPFGTAAAEVEACTRVGLGKRDRVGGR